MFAARRISTYLLLSILVCSLLMHYATANVLKKSLAPDRNLEDSLICQLTILDVQFETRGAQEIYQCLIDHDQNGIGDVQYAIDLPFDFLEEHGGCMDYGPCYISIPGGKLHEEDEPFISIPDNSKITVEDGYGSRQRRLSITGDRPTLVVRVTIDGWGPDPSTEDLAGSVFGLGDNPAAQSMAGQFRDCSFGKLKFSPAQGNSIWNGVMDIEISTGGGTLSILSLRSELKNAVKNKMPQGGRPKHIMFVVPSGTAFQGDLDWVAFANVDDYRSYFNNWWGDSLTTTMHEIGHNLGFHHSGEGSELYGDDSGLMGQSYLERGAPRMCFDGFKSYILGWYSDKTVIVDPSTNGPWTGQLSAFIDYDSNAATTVLIKVGQAHLLFNRKKGMNEGTGEKGDLVTVSNGNKAFGQSWNVGGLGKGQTTIVDGAVIKVCSIKGESAQVSIYTEWQSSGC